MKPEKKKLYDRRYYDKKKNEANKLYDKIGKKCFICGSGIRLVCHRKDFIKHILFLDLSVKQIKNIDPSKYVRLCYPCHYGVHWVYNYLKFSWDEIIKHLSIS